jgi:hypothetical protein
MGMLKLQHNSSENYYVSHLIWLDANNWRSLNRWILNILFFIQMRTSWASLSMWSASPESFRTSTVYMEFLHGMVAHMVISIKYAPLAMISHALDFEIRHRTWTYTASELFTRLLLSEPLESFSLRLHISSCNSSLLCSNRSQCRGVFLILRIDSKYFAIRSSPTTESLTAPARKLKRTALIWQ